MIYKSDKIIEIPIDFSMYNVLLVLIYNSFE